jgi:hypothetical protein
VFEVWRAAEGLLTEALRTRVEQDADFGLYADFCPNTVYELKDEDSGEVGVVRGGRGARLGRTKRSGSSATSSKLGLNSGGVIACMAILSGVVRAYPK